MELKTNIEEFNEKFINLSPENQRYIVGIQQALLYAQSDVRVEKENSETEYSTN